ncbi:MAG: hypothetical protein ACQEUB_12260, partial [Thermodesulfobacteriota bacterium]
ALLIEKLSPRLPGESDPGVFERSGPGNDGGGHPCVSFVIKLAVFSQMRRSYEQDSTPVAGLAIRVRQAPAWPGRATAGRPYKLHASTVFIFN